MLVLFETVVCEGIVFVTSLLGWLWARRRDISKIGTVLVFAVPATTIGCATALALFSEGKFDLKWFGVWGIGLAAAFWPLARVGGNLVDVLQLVRIRRAFKAFLGSLVSFALGLAALYLAQGAAKLSSSPDTYWLGNAIISVKTETLARCVAAIFGLHGLCISLMLYNLFIASLPERLLNWYEKLRLQGAIHGL